MPMTSTKTRRWLLGNDGSAAAMQAAHYVARWWRTFAVSKVEVITALADNDRLRPPTAVEAEERPHHIRSEDTERVAAVLQRAGVDVQCSITAGAPADVLLREA